MPQKILITGGSGFIGRNLAEIFCGRYDILAPPRQELDLLNETAVRDYLARHHFDTVIHSATGRSNRRVTEPDLFKKNCRMFFNFARNQHLFGRMLHFGSGAEFGIRVPRMPESLFDVHLPDDDYGFAKYIASQYTEKANNIYNLRLFGVFGKYEAWDVRFISNAICRILHGLPVIIRQNVYFDYLYVHDLAALTSWFLKNEPKHKTYNVCRGQSCDLASIARIVAEISGRNPQIQIQREGLAPEYSGDNARLLQEIGGFCFRDLKASIAELYAWYEAHLVEIDPAKLRFDG